MVGLEFIDLVCTGATPSQLSWLRRCIKAANKGMVGALQRAGPEGSESLSDGGAMRALIQTVKNEEVPPHMLSVLCEFVSLCNCVGR